MNEQETKDTIKEELVANQYGVASGYFHSHNGVDSPTLQFKNLRNILGIVAAKTSGTTSVTVFSPLYIPPSITITGVFLISNDTTAGNISLYNSGRTVATIAKGTTTGALVGATTLTNSTNATIITVKSDSAGNSTVFMTYST